MSHIGRYALHLACVMLATGFLMAQQRTETFWQKVMRVLGVSATPGSLRSPNGEFDGDIWMVTTSTNPTKRQITRRGSYRSPVFDSGGTSLLALRGNSLVRVAIASGEAAEIRSVDGVEKLIGFNRDESDQLLIIANGAPRFLSIAKGQQVPIPYNANLRDDLAMLNHLRGWARDYGDSRVYVNHERKPALGGDLEWMDVYWKRNSANPVNVSECDGVRCGQPSLSPDGKNVVYIRAMRN
jgi:hypothetical protein